MRSSKAIIDRQALRHNLQQVKQIANKSQVMAVVKANAYGHGLLEVAQTLQDADMFAVATLEEAIRLRESGIDKQILLLEGFFSIEELDKVLEYRLQMVVHHWPQIEMLKSYQQQNPQQSATIVTWLKCDSGMYRLGFAASELSKILAELKSITLVEKPIKLMSHFASSDSDQLFSQVQLSEFLQMAEDSDCEKSMANSAGILMLPESHLDWVRPGLLLYGASPVAGTRGAEHNLKPAMSLESQLFSVKPIKAGQSTGYGRHWFAEQDTLLGIVSIGYGDGYPRNAKNGTPIWLNGRQVPLVGRVSMDMLAVDLGLDSQDKVGDRVVLWGKELPMEEVAPFADTIPYTLCCGVTSRVKFEYIN